MARASLPKATWLEILLLLPHLVKCIFAALAQLVTSTFFARRGQTTVLKQVCFTLLRTHLRSVTLAQELVLPSFSTDYEYRSYAKRNRIPPTTTVINSKLPLHWIGPTTADKVLLYFHGGGYFIGASAGHLKWLADLQRYLSHPSRTVSIVLVSYTLSPEAPWPQQLKDATDALRYFLQEQKRSPSDIAIGGDSAGGHLTVSLLTHLLHPQPDVRPLALSEPLMTAVLISPFIRLDLSQDSWTRNYYSDYIPHEAAKRWTDCFLGDSAKDKHNTPGLGDEAWFRGIDKVVKDILIWGGGGECFIDSIKLFDKTLKAVLPSTKLVVQEGAAHEEFIVDAALGYKEKGQATKLIESWLVQRL